MNINIKKEQTSKLADSIKDELETLKARQLYFENDVQFMHKFIDGIKKQAQQAQSAVESELKQQQTLVSKLNALDAEVQKIDNLISKDTQVLQSLEEYQKFIEDLYQEKGNPNWRYYKPKVNQEVLLFMTEGGASIPQNTDEGVHFVIKYEPTNMIQIFNNSEQANIRQIQKLQDKQDEIQTVKMLQKKQETMLIQVIKDSEDKISLLQKNCAKKLSECQRLRQMRKANTNKISILENQNLDIEKLKTRIFSLYEQVNHKRSKEIQQSNSQTEIKKQMTQIQGDIQKLRFLIKQQKELWPHLIPQIEKDIKAKQKEENMRRNQEQNKRLELKKQQEQQKKRSQAQNQKQKGRKDMQKVMLIKKPKAEKKVAVEKEDYDQQYLHGDD